MPAPRTKSPDGKAESRRGKSSDQTLQRGRRYGSRLGRGSDPPDEGQALARGRRRRSGIPATRAQRHRPRVLRRLAAQHTGRRRSEGRAEGSILPETVLMQDVGRAHRWSGATAPVDASVTLLASQLICESAGLHRIDCASGLEAIIGESAPVIPHDASAETEPDWRQFR